MNELPMILIGICLGFFLSLILHVVLPCNFESAERKIKLTAIENNVAYYHPKTGEFTFKELK